MNGRDRILDRYINGDLSGSELDEFNRLLESDPELREVVEADRLLTETMAKDRAFLSGVDHSATYASFLAGLASPIPSSTDAPTPVPAPSSPTSVVGWAGTFVGKMLLSSTVAVIVALGVLTIQSDPESHPAPQQPAPAAVRTPAPAAPATAAPSIPEHRAVEQIPPAASTEPRTAEAPSSRQTSVDPASARNGRSSNWSLGSSADKDLPVFRKDSISVQMTQQKP